MTQNSDDGKSTPDASKDPEGADVGATEAVNRALGSASDAASKASEFAGDVADGLKPHVTSVVGTLKADALNLPRMGEMHMIGLVFGLAGLATLLAMASWLNYTLFFTVKYGGFLAHMDGNQLRISNDVYARMGLSLPSWRPFLGILIFTPLAATLTYTAALALRMAGDGRANPIDAAVAVLQRNLRPILLLWVPLALLAAIGTVNFTVETLLRQFAVQAGEISAAEAPWRRVFDIVRIMPPEVTGGPVPPFVSPLSVVSETFQRNLATWDWLIWIVQVPLFVWVLLRISRALPSLQAFVQFTEASWAEITARTQQGSLFKRLRTRRFVTLLAASLGIYLVARVLLWLTLVIFQFFGTGIFAWIMKLIIVLPISAASIAAIACVIVALTRYLPTDIQPDSSGN